MKISKLSLYEWFKYWKQPRYNSIKLSTNTWYPDVFRGENFYLGDEIMPLWKQWQKFLLTEVLSNNSFQLHYVRTADMMLVIHSPTSVSWLQQGPIADGEYKTRWLYNEIVSKYSHVLWEIVNERHPVPEVYFCI